MTLAVEEVRADETWPLRRRVLRAERPDATERFTEDEGPSSLHLAVRDGNAQVVGVATFFPSPTVWRPGVPAWQLRGMAVDPAWQGSGVGRQIMDAAVPRLRAAGAAVVWANVRDSAMGFYQRLGWQVVDDGFINELGIPHHVAVLDL